MDIKQEILHYYRVEELSLREISRRLQIDRKTVTKLVRSYEEALKNNPETGMDDFLAQVPKYKTRVYQPRLVKDAIAKEIDKWLKENERRRSAGMKKQCLKRKDIHRQLLEGGYSVSYSAVCKYIARQKVDKKPKTKDVYLRIHREPGQECEFDWGEVKLFFNGKQETLMMAVFAFPYSKGRYAYLFHRQDTLAFMESHRNFFKDVEGVPHTMIYDNMRVAVVFDKDKKKPTDALMRMSTFYKYQWRFCNARAGWEKGNVERSVDYVRGRAFTTRVDFSSIQEAQTWLDNIVNTINIEAGSISTSNKSDMLTEDLVYLQEYPGEFGCFEIAEYKVDKQATICMNTNHYSVPDKLAGERVVVQVYSEKLVIYDRLHNRVATHPRSYESGKWIVDINHYINTLMKKTSAIQYSEAFHQMPMSMQVIYHQYFHDNGKEFLQMVKYVRDNNIAYEDVVQAADTIRHRGVKTFTADHIKVALSTMAAPEETIREDQKSDDYYEIELGSEDILSQLDSVMGGDTGNNNLAEKEHEAVF